MARELLCRFGGGLRLVSVCRAPPIPGGSVQPFELATCPMGVAHVAPGFCGEEQNLIHARPVACRRLTAAVTAVLAVTVGTSVPLVLTAPAAVAASVPAVDGAGVTAVTVEQTPVSIPPGAVLTSVGTTGFLTTLDGANPWWRWTRFADGSTTEMNGRAYGSSSDIVLVEQGDAYILQDMSGGAAPVQIDRSALNSTYSLRRVVGATLVMTVTNTAGGTDLHFVDKQDGALRDRTVTGLPKNATFGSVSIDAPAGMLLVSYTVPTATTSRLALVDVATGAVIETRDTRNDEPLISVSASATHLAWNENSREAGRTLVVAPRGSGEPERIGLGGYGLLRVDLLGDWVLYAQPGGGKADEPDPLYTLTARSLETGATVKLLDHTHFGGMTAPDGSLVAQGGTVAQGEGLYRISLDSDGMPIATMVASSGEPTKVTILGHTIPSVIDLDRNRGVISLDTTVSRPNMRLEIELTHTASQRRWTVTRVPQNTWDPGAETINVSWDGRFNLAPGETGEFVAAYNGAYTWRIKATPLNGIGPVAEVSGAFTVVRGQAPHDFSDNGSPDLLVVDATGRLKRHDSAYRLDINGLYWPAVSAVGTGWQIYDRFTAPGNLGGTSHADIVTRDKTGGLWTYEGKGTPGTPFAPRKKVGPGWQIYDKITGGGDLNADGKPDLLAADKAGGLWLYTGTGNITTPFSQRKKIGGGWGIYNQITAVGNIAGTGADDLVARDRDGVQWLYLGKGDGTFAARTKIGGGWNAYSHLVAVGDANRDGRPDLVAYGAGPAYVYASTGDWRAPFAPRRGTTGTWPSVKNIAVF
ncbi:VCBS repeat-containing protein [Streptomyces sp. ISL-1]|uniref:FG-GAP repeat domain-containing protein n=1 Tax=Streptomyces sp. ISL-1 TaxID=2817657 RepID=UPI001BE682B8|nr:VCBS repeat-containing protein [Streptomyces sp. ISL-1]MBT2392607.1 VCBS repeat-containing protein [Streptomyces sp. ISL-1]